MSTRPFIAARVELWFDRRWERFFRRLGWRERVIPYTGYGTQDAARVLGRVVLSPQWRATQIGKVAEEFLTRRGWRNFFTAACVHARYEVTCGDAVVTGTSDRGGYIDHRLRGHGLEPGWQDVTIRTADSSDAAAQVLIVADSTQYGLVSDIDDTVLTTMLPRPMVAAWNSFIRTENARLAVPGMAVLYDRITAACDGAPVIYLSTGAWNTHGFLSRFLRRHRFPHGPMLLTDWGPTNTGWFRSGQMHKRQALLQLSVDFPHITWILVGDDGQHDPEVYAEFARNNSSRVKAILIRQLTPAEQVLAHGTTEPIQQVNVDSGGVSVLRAPDGRGLLASIGAVLPG